MENGDSAHSEHTHRSSNNAGHYQLHGTWSLCTLSEKWIVKNEKFATAADLLPPQIEHEKPIAKS